MEDRTILLVEDNLDDELLTRRALKKGGIRGRVVVARDGAAALDFLFGDEALPRFVLLDLKLPKVDGAEVLRRIRADERTEGLIVVVMASRDGEGYPGEERADLCIDKSVDYDAFLRTIRRLEVLLAGRTAWTTGRTTGRGGTTVWTA